VSGNRPSSKDHQSPTSPSSSGSKLNTPPTKFMVPRWRNDLGATSANLAGTRSCHTDGGSITWSSTETIHGMSASVALVSFATSSMGRAYPSD
jgi:hypothetical protein